MGALSAGPPLTLNVEAPVGADFAAFLGRAVCAGTRWYDGNGPQRWPRAACSIIDICVPNRTDSSRIQVSPQRFVHAIMRAPYAIYPRSGLFRFVTEADDPQCFRSLTCSGVRGSYWPSRVRAHARALARDARTADTWCVDGCCKCNTLFLLKDIVWKQRELMKLYTIHCIGVR